MAIIYVSLFITVVFALVGVLVWIVARLLEMPNAGWKIFKGTFVSLLLFLPLFIFFISPLILSYWVSSFGTRPPERRMTDTPVDYGSNFVNVAFPSRDGLMLRGWLMEGGGIRPTLILGHGLFRSRREGLRRGAALHQRGYSVLLFDFRNHGESEESSTSLGFQERLDVLGAYDFLKERGARQFVMLGVSMGAVSVIHAAAELQEGIAAIIADSPFQGLNKTITHHAKLMIDLPPFPFVDVFLWNFTRLNQYSAEELNTLEAVQQLKGVPILLIYGERDRRMPPASRQNILDAIPSARKKMVVFEDATHGAAYRVNPELYVDTVAKFLAEAGN